jgi:hypothetical protein
MFLSIYVFLPLFIGVNGYALIVGLDRGRVSYVLASMIYLINLDLNLFLPFWLVLLALLPVYWFIYPWLKSLWRCTHCTAFFSVLAIDLLFLGVVESYDFILQVDTIALDSILLYTLLVDLIVAVVLL